LVNVQEDLASEVLYSADFPTEKPNNYYTFYKHALYTNNMSECAFRFFYCNCSSSSSYDISDIHNRHLTWYCWDDGRSNHQLYGNSYS